MKKVSLVLFTMLASTSMMAADLSSSSLIKLPGGGEIPPMGNVKIALASLQQNVHYNITCQVTNAQSEAVDMRFEMGNGKVNGSAYSQILLNDAVLMNAQGSAHSGDNTVVITEATNLDTTPSELSFRNLDTVHTVQVDHCVARPAIKKVSSGYRGGLFIASNESPHWVEIKVGNFFPTSYNIAPYSNRWVSVSTDNQNIAIARVW